MAFYLSKERNEDVVVAYRRYQQYLNDNQKAFPSGAYALATAEWWQLPSDSRSPHDARLEAFSILENGGAERNGRSTAIRMKLMGTVNIELFYPQVFKFELQTPTCLAGLGDWLYDEFTLSQSGRLIHEIEWAGFGRGERSRWIIEASDIEVKWLPQDL
jgi:hypothetical protein